MNPILTLSLAPLRLPVKMEEVSAAAPAAFRKSLRPVDACAMPLVVSGFGAGDGARARGRVRGQFPENPRNDHVQIQSRPHSQAAYRKAAIAGQPSRARSTH